jgi:arylsulfatase
MTVDETFNVGSDMRTPVDDKDYAVPFEFTGEIEKLTFNLGPEQLTAADRKTIHSALARAHD